VNRRFPLLSSIAACLRFLGALLLLAGAFYSAYEGIIEPNQPGRSFAVSDFLQIMAGAAVLSFGVLVIALAEVIGVLFAIEDNTYRAVHSAESSTQGAPLTKSPPWSSVNRHAL